MGEKSQRNACSVGDLLERGFGKAVFAEQFLGSLQKRFLFRDGFHVHCLACVRHGRCAAVRQGPGQEM